jgi:hypothetical protein
VRSRCSTAPRPRRSSAGRTWSPWPRGRDEDDADQPTAPQHPAEPDPIRPEEPPVRNWSALVLLLLLLAIVIAAAIQLTRAAGM